MIGLEITVSEFKVVRPVEGVKLAGASTRSFGGPLDSAVVSCTGTALLSFSILSNRLLLGVDVAGVDDSKVDAGVT